MQIEWTESYQIYKASVAGVLRLQATWTHENGGGYKVTCEGAGHTWRLKDLSADVEAGKTRAIVLARRKLAEAMAVLGEA